jgi:chemotaxis signal transduction protein
MDPEISTPPARQDVNALLRERSARYSARTARRTEPRARRDTLLLAGIGPERIAFDAACVVAVVRRSGELPLPLAPDHVPFAFGFRGEALCVIALSVLQGRGALAPAPAQRVIVVRWNAGRAGLLVDEAIGVIQIARSSVRPLEEHLWLPAVAVDGVLPDGVVILNVEGLARELSSEGKTE